MRDQNRSFFLVALCVLAVCCQPVVRAGSSEQVSVTVGRKFTVALASNPGTGYSWVLADSLPGWLDEVDKTYVTANPGLPGGGGTEYRTFQATGSGSTSLTFQHKRPWEGTPIKVHLCKVTATESTDAQNIFVVPGESFTVALSSNPSTGYSWTLAGSLPNWLERVDKIYVATNPGLPGGGGAQYWTFQATGSGSTSLNFQYERPWEGTPIKVHVCKVTATASANMRNIFLVVGEEFTVALTSNPTTGYSWTLSGSLPSWLVQVDNTFIATNPLFPGGCGTEYWTFRSTAVGSVSLTFRFGRSSEGTPIKIRVCRLVAIPPTDTENLLVVTDKAFTMTLASNPSTGYSWMLAGSLPRWLENVDKIYVATNPGLPGGGGAEYWTFRATTAGNSTLVFQYERPWEGKPIQTYICHVKATSPYDTEKTSVTVGDEFLVEVR